MKPMQLFFVVFFINSLLQCVAMNDKNSDESQEDFDNRNYILKFEDLLKPITEKGFDSVEDFLQCIEWGAQYLSEPRNRFLPHNFLFLFEHERVREFLSSDEQLQICCYSILSRFFPCQCSAYGPEVCKKQDAMGRTFMILLMGELNSTYPESLYLNGKSYCDARQSYNLFHSTALDFALRGAYRHKNIEIVKKIIEHAPFDILLQRQIEYGWLDRGCWKAWEAFFSDSLRSNDIDFVNVLCNQQGFAPFIGRQVLSKAFVKYNKNSELRILLGSALLSLLPKSINERYIKDTCWNQFFEFDLSDWPSNPYNSYDDLCYILKRLANRGMFEEIVALLCDHRIKNLLTSVEERTNLYYMLMEEYCLPLNSDKKFFCENCWQNKDRTTEDGCISECQNLINKKHRLMFFLMGLLGVVDQQIGILDIEHSHNLKKAAYYACLYALERNHEDVLKYMIESGYIEQIGKGSIFTSSKKWPYILLKYAVLYDHIDMVTAVLKIDGFMENVGQQCLWEIHKMAKTEEMFDHISDIVPWRNQICNIL